MKTGGVGTSALAITQIALAESGGDENTSRGEPLLTITPNCDVPMIS